MEHRKQFTKDILTIENIDDVINKITGQLKNDVLGKLKKSGAVIGISGGIDSSVTIALASKALGPDKVVGLILPEKDSSGESKRLALKLAGQLGVRTIEENITAALDGFNCYQRRDEAVSRVFPEYTPNTFRMKIGINRSGLNQNLPPVFSVTIVDSKGKEKSGMIPLKEYLQIVAASNFKQRSRMAMLYYHAEVLNYAVIGTPNKHEVEQGFFVKNGDSGADIMPISHLYKSQVYQFAEVLGIPQEIINRTPTSDTYTAEQTQEEFFFQMPYKEMDLLWYGYENNYEPGEVGQVLGKTKEEVELAYRNFARKQKTTEYLRMEPIRYNLL
jgi:NAD+ synthase